MLGSLDLLSITASRLYWNPLEVFPAMQCTPSHAVAGCSPSSALEKRLYAQTLGIMFSFFLSLKDCIADSLLKWLWTQFDSRHNLGILATWDMQMWFFCLVLTLPKHLILIIHLVQCFYSHSLPIKSCLVLNSLLFLLKGFLSSYVREEGTTHQVQTDLLSVIWISLAIPFKSINLLWKKMSVKERCKWHHHANGSSVALLEMLNHVLEPCWKFYVRKLVFSHVLSAKKA